MLVKLTLYSLVCDGCGRKLRGSHGDTVIMAREFTQVSQAAKTAGWRLTDDRKNLCPDCQKRTNI